jgi:type I restriction enzyme, R subunit
MAAPGEHKTVQARILAYAQEIGWRYVPRAEAEARRGFDPDAVTPEERARKASLYFGDLLHAQVRAFNPKYKEAEGALVGEFQRLHADIYGNRDFLQALRNQHKYFCAEESRELEARCADAFRNHAAHAEQVGLMFRRGQSELQSRAPRFRSGSLRLRHRS